MPLSLSEQVAVVVEAASQEAASSILYFRKSITFTSSTSSARIAFQGVGNLGKQKWDAFKTRILDQLPGSWYIVGEQFSPPRHVWVEIKKDNSS